VRVWDGLPDLEDPEPALRLILEGGVVFKDTVATG
jgi:hypothetical protein